jgi:hypothetical protein
MSAVVVATDRIAVERPTGSTRRCCHPLTPAATTASQRLEDQQGAGVLGDGDRPSRDRP